MPSDRELLLQYARQGDEAEFAELVRRHADFVYSVALRVTCNSALAQDVTQVVFTQLARQATQLDNYNSLVGWLHTAARRRAIDAVRTEERRRAREHEATAMQQNSATPETNWTEIRPLLDEAVGQLRETDREAVLLRFFKNLSHQEVGTALGLGEEAARKRVDRALDKLREHFARRGVKASSTLLATAMAENSVQAAPVGLAARITAPALAASGTVTTGGLLLKILLMSTQTKFLAIAAIVVITATLTLSWPLMKRSSVSPPTLSTGRSSAALVPNKPKAAAQVAPPSAPAVMASNSPATAAAPRVGPAPIVLNTGQTQFTAGPQTDLNSAIVTGLHFLAPPDLPGFAKTLLPLSVVGTDGEGVGLSLEDYVAQLSQKKDINEHLTSMMEALSALDGQTPGLNDAGDRAIFHLDPPVGGHKVIIFNKIGGYWYLDGM